MTYNRVAEAFSEYRDTINKTHELLNTFVIKKQAIPLIRFVEHAVLKKDRIPHDIYQISDDVYHRIGNFLKKMYCFFEFDFEPDWLYKRYEIFSSSLNYEGKHEIYEDRIIWGGHYSISPMFPKRVYKACELTKSLYKYCCEEQMYQLFEKDWAAKPIKITNHLFLLLRDSCYMSAYQDENTELSTLLNESTKTQKKELLNESLLMEARWQYDLVEVLTDAKTVKNNPRNNPSAR